MNNVNNVNIVEFLQGLCATFTFSSTLYVRKGLPIKLHIEVVVSRRRVCVCGCGCSFFSCKKTQIRFKHALGMVMSVKVCVCVCVCLILERHGQLTMSQGARGLDLRKQGERRTKTSCAGIAQVFKGPFSSVELSSPGAVQVVGDQMVAIHQLYTTNASMQAARQILMGQLLSSGIVLRRNGKDVLLTEGFAKHLENVWISFARNVIDSFVQYGFCVVSIEEEDVPPFLNFRRGLSGDDGQNRYMENLEKRQKVGMMTSRHDENMTARDLMNSGKNLIPCVCELGSYSVSFVMGGRKGYKRRYKVSACTNAQAMQVDMDVGIFFKSEPDSYGNINSAVATCFDQAAFVSALQELALNAEVVRARTQLVTQPAPKVGTAASQLDAANMFFDSESRAIQEQERANLNGDQVRREQCVLILQ